MKIICPIHGLFKQKPSDALNGHFCPKCGITRRNIKRNEKAKKNFEKKAKEIHGDKYDYSLVNYEKALKKVKIICPTHGIFEQKPSNHLLGQGCPKCGKFSKGEEKINIWLKENNFKENEDFFQQYKFKECKYKKELPFDFYLPKQKILIEYQGLQHYEKRFGMSEKKFKELKERDKIKKDFATKNFIFKEISYKDNIEEELEQLLIFHQYSK